MDLLVEGEPEVCREGVARGDLEVPALEAGEKVAPVPVAEGVEEVEAEGRILTLTVGEVEEHPECVIAVSITNTPYLFAVG